MNTKNMNDVKVPTIKLTNYVIRDYNETSPKEVLKSVAPYSGVTRPVLFCHYGFKSVLNSLSDLRMEADESSKFFYEISISVEVGKVTAGRVSREMLEETSLLNLSYINKDLKDHIENLFGYRMSRHATGSLMFTPAEIEKIHKDPLFEHMDVIVFPGVTNSPVKPDSYAALFYTENVVAVENTNPNKGVPFEISLPELEENPVYEGYGAPA